MDPGLWAEAPGFEVAQDVWHGRRDWGSDPITPLNKWMLEALDSSMRHILPSVINHSILLIFDILGFSSVHV